MKKKILHVTTVKKLTSGQRKQLRYECRSATQEKFNWKTIALVDELCGEDFEIEVPKLFKGNMRRKLFFWIWIMQNHRRKSEILIQRYSTFDPFSLIFGWFFCDRYVVHHSIEIEELEVSLKQLKKKIALSIERVSSHVISKQIKGRLVVSDDIGKYYANLSGRDLQIFKYYNGIFSRDFPILEDNRTQSINIAFVASSFASWHGLDLLLDSMEQSHALIIKDFQLHLIGKIFREDLERIHSTPSLSKLITIHGNLENPELKDVLSQCDIGLSSFNLQIKKMNEATTLKVREYLCGGLPVCSGHIDSAFKNSEFEFYNVLPPNICEILSYARQMRAHSRYNVRKKSLWYIDKLRIMSEIIVSIG